MKNKTDTKKNSKKYIERKSFFDKLLTIYGRKPVLEALEDRSVNAFRLHLSDSNKNSGIINRIVGAADSKGTEIVYHSKKELSRISKNSKQDQGVALDLHLDKFLTVQEFLKENISFKSIVALDGINNPANLGMIIRSACAGFTDGILLPSEGTAKISPLVIKSSAGCVFKTMIITCGRLSDAIIQFKKKGVEVCSLASGGSMSLFEYKNRRDVIYVLGNETEGVSEEVLGLSDKLLHIPMKNGVESLNVAAAATLISYQGFV